MQFRVNARNQHLTEFTPSLSGKFHVDVTGSVILDYRRSDIDWNGPYGTTQFKPSSTWLDEDARCGQLIFFIGDEKYYYKGNMSLDLKKGETIKAGINDSRPFVDDLKDSGYADNKGFFNIKFVRCNSTPYTKLERALIKSYSNHWRELEAQSPIGFNFIDLWDADKCPIKYLPWLAYSYGVPIWEKTWTEQQKRSIVKNYRSIRKIAGTLGSVRKAIEALFLDVKITKLETPYHFNVAVRNSDDPINQELIETVRVVSETFKRMVSTYQLSQFIELQNSLYITANMRVAVHLKIGGDSVLEFQFTTKGLELMAKVRDGTGIDVDFTKVALGKGIYDFDPSMLDLNDKFKELDVSQVTQGEILHSFDIATVYDEAVTTPIEIYEIGVYTGDGLICVANRKNKPLIIKTERELITITSNVQFDSTTAPAVVLKNDLNLSIASQLAEIAASLADLNTRVNALEAGS